MELEMFKLTQKIFGRPWGIESDDFLYGEERARYYELVNATRAAEGLEPLVNDEAGKPEFTVDRARRVEAAVAAHEEHIRTETARMHSSPGSSLG